MTRKQTIYLEMLRWTLPHLRNVSTWPWWQHLSDRSAFFEAELIHNLPASMFEAEFVEHDIWFLNVQARAYCQECSPELSPLYAQQIQRIRELLTLVPNDLTSKLQWAGPR